MPKASNLTSLECMSFFGLITFISLTNFFPIENSKSKIIWKQSIALKIKVKYNALNVFNLN